MLGTRALSNVLAVALLSTGLVGAVNVQAQGKDKKQTQGSIEMGAGKQVSVQPIVEGALSTLNNDDATKVRKLLENNIRSMRAIPGTGMMATEVEGQGMIYVSTNGRFAIVGGVMVDTWNMVAITSAKDLDEIANRIQLKAVGLSADDITMFNFGKGKEDVVIFIDPNCPYCHQMLDQMKPLYDQYRFRIVIMPILGESSVIQARKMECTENKAEALKALFEHTAGSLPHLGDCSPKVTQRGLVAGRRLGIKSVPFTIAPNGQTKLGAITDLGGWLSVNRAEGSGARK